MADLTKYRPRIIELFFALKHQNRKFRKGRKKTIYFFIYFGFLKVPKCTFRIKQITNILWAIFDKICQSVNLAYHNSRKMHA